MKFDSLTLEPGKSHSGICQSLSLGGPRVPTDATVVNRHLPKKSGKPHCAKCQGSRILNADTSTLQLSLQREGLYSQTIVYYIDYRRLGTPAAFHSKRLDRAYCFVLFAISCCIFAMPPAAPLCLSSFSYPVHLHLPGCIHDLYLPACPPGCLAGCMPS